jgi:hypothetical protein
VDEEEEEVIDWAAIGTLADAFFRRAPCMSFLNGPFGMQAATKERKQKEKSKSKPVGDAVVPENVDPTREVESLLSALFLPLLAPCSPRTY